MKSSTGSTGLTFPATKVGSVYVSSAGFRNPRSASCTMFVLQTTLRPSLAAMLFDLTTAVDGIGNNLNYLRMTRLLVLTYTILTDPVLLPVGDITMQSSVPIRLSVFGTIHCVYSPNPILKSSNSFTYLPENATRGLSTRLSVPDVW